MEAQSAAGRWRHLSKNATIKLFWDRPGPRGSAGESSEVDAGGNNSLFVVKLDGARHVEAE